MKLEKIEAITYSKICNNFVIHIPNEYDYYLSTPYKDELISKMAQLKKHLKQPPLKFYMVDEIDLDKFVKKEGKKEMKYPKIKPIELDYEKLMGFMKRKQQEKVNNIKNT